MCVFCLSTYPSISRQNQCIHPCIRLLYIYINNIIPIQNLMEHLGDVFHQETIPYIRFGSTSLQTTLEPKGPSNLPIHQLSQPGLEGSGYNRPVELSHNPHGLID